MVPFERAMVVSYRLSIVTIVLPLTIRPQFAVKCRQQSNQQRCGILRQNLESKQLTDVSQILNDLEETQDCRTQNKACQYLLSFQHSART